MASKKTKLKEEDDHNNDQVSESITSNLNTMSDDEVSIRLKAKKKKIVYPKGVNKCSSQKEAKKKELREANTRKDDQPPTAEVQPEGSGSYYKQSSPAEGPSAAMAAATTSNQASSYQPHFDLNQPASVDPSYQLPPRFDSLNQPGSSFGNIRAPLHQSRRGRPRKGSLNQPGSSSGFTRAPLRLSRRGRSRKGSLNQPGSSSNPASVAPPFQRYFDLNQLPSVAPVYQECSDLNKPASVTPSYQQHFDLNQPPNQFLPCYDSLNQPAASANPGSNQAPSCQLPPRFGSPYQPGSSTNPAFSRDAAYQLQALQQHQPFNNPNANTLPSTGAVGFLQGGRSTSSNAFALVASDFKDGENKGDFGKTTESVTGSTSGKITADDKSNRPVVSTAGQVLSATDIDRSSSSTESDELIGYKKNADTSQEGNTPRKKRSEGPVSIAAGEVFSATDTGKEENADTSHGSLNQPGSRTNLAFYEVNTPRKKRSNRRRYLTNTTKWNWAKFPTVSHKRNRRRKS